MTEADPEQAAEHEEKDGEDEEDEESEYEFVCANSSCKCSTYILTFAALAGLIGMILGSLAYHDVQVMIKSNPYYNAAGGATVGVVGNNVTGGSNNNNNSATSPDKDGEMPKISMLDEILKRGTLHCGLPFANTYGFLQQANEGDDVWTGFDVELCKAISAAIFGTPNFVPIVMDTADERWSLLASRDVDVVMRSTHTLERDVYVEQTAAAAAVLDPDGKLTSAGGTGFEFSPVYFYDGVVFGGLPPFATTCAETLNTTSVVCESLRICAVNGTTHLQAVREMFDERHIRPQPNVGSLYAALQDETCNVIAWEMHGITEPVVRLHGYTGLYETGTKIISREPLAMVTRQEDPVWTDFVFWIMQALVAAEEKGIKQGEAMEFQETALFGERFKTMFQNALAATGNYGEMYQNTLEQYIPRGGMNRINGGDTGLLYSLPFGKLDVLGADIEKSSPTIRAIRERGFLKCGINKRKGFATFDPATRSWSGFDVELCRAIAAAVFEQGVQDDHVIYSDLPTSQRFQVLADGRVDVLARLTTWTMQRDVQENATSRAFSFATPYFHDGVQFGGLPPFSTCAENLDIFSPECQPLMICVVDGSTSHDKLQQLFHSRYFTTKLLFDEIIQALNDGTCNALAGGFHDVAVATIREKGYNGTYEVAPTRFSKDPLGIVTRQDGGDMAWSDFVRWIFLSLVYAEEHNITQATAMDMPRSTLFGPLRSETFFHVINTVGNYGEMYERNFAELANRGGLNALNDNGGPQMYALAGI